MHLPLLVIPSDSNLFLFIISWNKSIDRDLFVASSGVITQCADGWDRIGKHCYHTSSQQMNWREAKKVSWMGVIVFCVN